MVPPPHLRIEEVHDTDSMQHSTNKVFIVSCTRWSNSRLADGHRARGHAANRSRLNVIAIKKLKLEADDEDVGISRKTLRHERHMRAVRPHLSCRNKKDNVLSTDFFKEVVTQVGPWRRRRRHVPAVLKGFQDIVSSDIHRKTMSECDDRAM